MPFPPDTGFGVSNPLWDYVLGTEPKKTSDFSKEALGDEPSTDLSAA